MAIRLRCNSVSRGILCDDIPERMRRSQRLIGDERFPQIRGLLAAMPMTLAVGLAADMKRLKRFKTALSTTAANMAPVLGEYLGDAHPHLLFIGRQGQPFFWAPFENEDGNHNVAICSKSGSGKCGCYSRYAPRCAVVSKNITG